MKRPTVVPGRLACVLAVVSAFAGSAAPIATAAPSERAFALSGTNLLTFDPAAPGTATSRAITGVGAGETLVGIDVRPQNGMLYGLGVNAAANTATLYVIGRETGQAGVVGVVPSTVAFTTNGADTVDLPAGDGYGFDVNPAADRVRVTNTSGLNFRVNPNTGAPVDGDNGGAVAGGMNPDGLAASVGGVAYTNDQPNNGNVTTLYTLNAANDQLAIQNPPNVGTQTLGRDVTLGGTPVNFAAVRGFDIEPGVNVASSNAAAIAGSGYAVLTLGATTHLYRISLADGAATDLGTIGDGSAAISGLALQRDLDDAGFPVVGLAADGLSLRRFQTATTNTITTMPLGGVTAGETVVAIAWRPQSGQFYGLGVNAVANTATLYLVDPQSGAATAVGTAGQIDWVNTSGVAVDLPAASAGWGIDVNPAADRVRVVAPGVNARVNPNTGAPVDGDAGGSAGSVLGVNMDGSHNGLPPGGTGVTAVSYTNAFTQPLTGGATTLYVLEPGSNQLLIQNPANAGTLTGGKTVTLGGVAVDFGPVAGLDIPGEVAVATSAAVASGSGIALLRVGGTDGVYGLDLATGAASLLGTVPGGLADLAVGDAQRDLPKPAPPVVTPTPTPDPGSTPVPPPSPVVVTPLAKDIVRPAVTKLAVKAARGRRLTITFTTSEAGSATVRLLRESSGRRKGSKCVAGRRTGKRCTLRSAYGSVTRLVNAAGKVTIVVKGTIAGKRLAVGALRAEVTVRDAAGNTSAVAGRSGRVRK